MLLAAVRINYVCFQLCCSKNEFVTYGNIVDVCVFVLGGVLTEKRALSIHPFLRVQSPFCTSQQLCCIIVL